MSSGHAPVATSASLLRAKPRSTSPRASPVRVPGRSFDGADRVGQGAGQPRPLSLAGLCRRVAYVVVRVVGDGLRAHRQVQPPEQRQLFETDEQQAAAVGMKEVSLRTPATGCTGCRTALTCARQATNWSSGTIHSASMSLLAPALPAARDLSSLVREPVHPRSRAACTSAARLSRSPRNSMPGTLEPLRPASAVTSLPGSFGGTG